MAAWTVLRLDVPVVVIRARDRNPDGPRPAVLGLGSAGRSPVTSQRSLYRGLGPGRGPFGRGAPKPVKLVKFGVTGVVAACATPCEHMAAANWVSAYRLKVAAKIRETDYTIKTVAQNRVSPFAAVACEENRT